MWMLRNNNYHSGSQFFWHGTAKYVFEIVKCLKPLHYQIHFLQVVCGAHWFVLPYDYTFLNYKVYFNDV